MTLSKLLFRRPPAPPWAALLLFVGCLGTTLPMFFSDRYYLILGVGHATADNPHPHWWNSLTSLFVHGGGFPGTAAHLAINAAFLLVLGGLVERTLGTGRFVALSLSCAVAEAVALRITGARVQGFSGVAWSYGVFAPAMLAHVWRTHRRAASRDPLTAVVALLLVVAALGLVKRWHLLSVAVGLPFFFAWRRVLRANLARLSLREPPLVWGIPARRAALALTAAAVGGSLGLTLAAVLGFVR